MAYNLNGITDISDFINYGKGLSLSKADLYLKEKTQSYEDKIKNIEKYCMGERY